MDDLVRGDGTGSSPSSVLTILEGMRGAGIDIDIVCGAMGLSLAAIEARDALVPPAQLAAMWREGARLYGRGTVGLAVAMAAPQGRQIVDYVASASRTLREAMQQFARYYRLMTRNADIELRREGELTALHLLPNLPRAAVPPPVIEFAVASFIRRVVALSGRQAREARLPHAPLGPRDDYARLGVAVTFEADAAIVFDDELLDAPCRGHDPNLFQFVRAHADSLLQREPRDASARAQVRRIVVGVIERGEPTLADIARALAMSERSLQRRLQEEASSFRDVVDDVRKELALAYLQDRRMTVSEVAYLLGYAEAGAFARAFKRWTGTTPGRALASPDERARDLS